MEKQQSVLEPQKPKRRKKKKSKRRILRNVLFVIIILLVAGIAIVTHMIQAGRNRLLQGMVPADEAVQEASNASAEGGLVTYKGKKYRYNENLVNILCMGIDNKKEKLEPKEQWGTSGQADSNMLVLYDTAENHARILALSRDSMVDIKCYDHDQNFMGWGENHLSIGFAMGDGAAVSCELMTEAVSRLLYGVPIQSYCALSVQKVGDLNDLLGGVTVTMPNDDLNKSPYYYKEGQEVKLTGEAATFFVQNRDTKVDGSNNGRMERQKLYLSTLIQTAKTQVAANPTMILSIMDSMDGYYLTNIAVDELLYLAQNAGGLTFSMQDDFYSLPGENDYDGVYDEFHIDDDALFELVLELFYEEVSE